MCSGSGFGCARRRKRGVSDESRSLRDVRIDNLEGAPPTTGDQTHAAVDRAADGHRCDRVDDLTIDHDANSGQSEG